jgi:uncharacterized protein YukE
MDHIHVETDELYNLGRAFENASLDFVDSYHEIRTAAYLLEANWQGGEAESFQDELMDSLRVIVEKIEQMEYLGRKLIRQAEVWDEIDQRWSAAYRDITPVSEEAIRA